MGVAGLYEDQVTEDGSAAYDSDLSAFDQTRSARCAPTSSETDGPMLQRGLEEMHST